MRRRAVGGKDAATTPAVVRHLVEVDVDLLGPEAVRADERLGHGGHRGGAHLRTARRLVDHHGGHGRPPKGHLVDTYAKGNTKCYPARRDCYRARTRRTAVRAGPPAAD